MKVKLTPAEQMLVSIANTERAQEIQRADAIYKDRIQSLLDTHELKWSDLPEVTQEGKEFWLVTKDVPLLPVKEKK